MQPQLLKFIGPKNYDYWSIFLKVLFRSQDLWDLVFTVYKEVADNATYNALPAEKKVLMENQKKDQKAFYLIFQSVKENILTKFQDDSQIYLRYVGENLKSYLKGKKIYV